MQRPPSLERLRPIFFSVGLIIALASVIGTLQYAVPIATIGPLTPDTLQVFSFDEPVIYTYQKEREKPKVQVNKNLPPEIIPDPFPDPDPTPDPRPDPTPLDTIIHDVDMDGDPEPEVDMDVHMVQHKPIFPGCEDLATEDERSACLEENLRKFLARTVEYPKFQKEIGVTGRSYIQFTVNRNGEVVNVQAVEGRNDPGLDKAAIEALKKLPAFSPGKHNGLPVNVHFTIPVTFRLQ